MLRSDHRGLRNKDLKLIWVGGWWWVVVGVQGKGHNKLSACQLTGIRPVSDWDGQGYVVLSLPIS